MILKGNFLYTPKLGELVIREQEYLVVKDGLVVDIYKELPQEYAGEPVTDYDGDIRLSCEGEGEIVAMGNEYGKSADDDMVTAIGGHALVAVRGIKAGKLTLKAQAEDLRAGRVQITVKD